MTSSVYEKLYVNMKNSYTIVEGSETYSLGSYMTMKANAKEEVDNAMLPVIKSKGEARPMAAFFSYVNDKLTVKKEPVKDKTIRAFPFRTSLASLVCALLVCALILSYGVFTFDSSSDMPSTVEAGDVPAQSVETIDDQIIDVNSELNGYSGISTGKMK